MTITVSVPDQLWNTASAHGLSVEEYVEQLAVRAAEAETTSSDKNPARAVDGLLAFRGTHHLTLGRDPALGLRAWLHQDHKR